MCVIYVVFNGTPIITKKAKLQLVADFSSKPPSLSPPTASARTVHSSIDGTSHPSGHKSRALNLLRPSSHVMQLVKLPFVCLSVRPSLSSYRNTFEPLQERTLLRKALQGIERNRDPSGIRLQSTLSCTCSQFNHHRGISCCQSYRILRGSSEACFSSHTASSRARSASVAQSESGNCCTTVR